MAWVSPKVYAILSSSEEGKDIIEKLPDMTQDECQKELDAFFGEGGKGSSSSNEYGKAKMDDEKEEKAYKSQEDGKVSDEDFEKERIEENEYNYQEAKEGIDRMIRDIGPDKDIEDVMEDINGRVFGGNLKKDDDIYKEIETKVSKAFEVNVENAELEEQKKPKEYKVGDYVLSRQGELAKIDKVYEDGSISYRTAGGGGRLKKEDLVSQDEKKLNALAKEREDMDNFVSNAVGDENDIQDFIKDHSADVIREKSAGTWQDMERELVKNGFFGAGNYKYQKFLQSADESDDFDNADIATRYILSRMGLSENDENYDIIFPAIFYSRARKAKNEAEGAELWR